MILRVRLAENHDPGKLVAGLSINGPGFCVDSGCHWHDPLYTLVNVDMITPLSWVDMHNKCFQACMRRNPVHPNTTRTIQHTRPVHWSLTADPAITHTYLPHRPHLPHNEEEPRTKGQEPNKRNNQYPTVLGWPTGPRSCFSPYFHMYI